MVSDFPLWHLSVLVKRIRHHLIYWVPVLACWGVITYFSSLPQQMLYMPSFKGMDKIIHALEYTALGALFSRAWLLSGPNGVRAARGAFVVTGLFAILVGFSDEWHQSFVVGRTPSLWDALADIVGSLLGAYLAKRLLERRYHD
jgi:hypothetical protein